MAAETSGGSHGVMQPASQSGALAPFPDAAGAAALMGFLMKVIASLVGLWIGASHDGSVFPLTLTIGACALASATSATGWVRGHDDVSQHG